MLTKWKLILSNWIKCYFNNTNKKDLSVNLESLLDIISHLRENFNLDESKSALLDAHTVQEFMVEKYPDFKFDNGTIEPDSDEEIYLVASLLLFFVCVNSKNVDMKSAMCNKLSPGDQEMILKFSKHLMECPKITITNLQAAIVEACGQDIAAPEPTSLRVPVAETPPALRSLHSEVRRLQAALDAERFDRTYLQEELTRTNTKVEKLLKDKEQYKLEIVNLKSQISLCCGQEKESQGEDVKSNNISKLTAQLEQIEESLLNAQEQLKDALEETETYKTKLSQLKAEREKLLLLNHQEAARASGLADELEVERRNAQTLRELVTELRQHNHLNRMETSLLEYDDPDASINSLQHNSSSCLEVCANVIEVQLGEERAKIVALEQQIQMLQDHLSDITRKTEEEKESLNRIISEKENTIMSLKHRVNEEIEEKNFIRSVFDDNVAKLNNELNELEQRLKGTQENSRNIIDKKMQEIQNLQEEKLSLLQSLSDETSKSESIIKRLQSEIDAEKSSKIKIRDEYDSHIMKLNEKVLNRNNELVELQNKILEKGEIIETLQLELRREKELKEEISNKYNGELIHLNSIRQKVEQDFLQKSEEARDLHNHLQQHIAFIEQVNKDNDHLKHTIFQLQGDCETVKDSKDKLLVELKNRDVKAEQIYKETENLKNMLWEAKQKLQHNIEENNATVNELKSQLRNATQEVSRLKEDIQLKIEEVEKVSNENMELNKLVIKYKSDIISLEEKNNEWKIKKDSSEVEFTHEILKLKNELLDKSKDYNILQSLLEESQAKVKTLNDHIADLNKQNANLQFERDKLTTQLEEMKTKMEITSKLVNEEHSKMKQDNQRLHDILEGQKSEITDLESLLMYEKHQNNLLQHDNNNEKLILSNKCDVLQNNHTKAQQESESKQTQIDILLVKMEQLTEEFDKNLRDRDVLISNLSKELDEIKEKLVKESVSKIDAINKLTRELEENTKTQTDTVKILKKENEALKKSLALKESYVVMLEDKNKEMKLKQDLSEVTFSNEVLKVNKELRDKTEGFEKLKLLLQENEAKLNDRIADLNKRNGDLDRENNELIVKLEEIKRNQEITAQADNEERSKMTLDKQRLLESLEAQKSEIIRLESMIMYEKQQNDVLQHDNDNERLNLTNKCDLLQRNQSEAQQQLEIRQKEIDLLTVKLKNMSETYDKDLRDRDVLISNLTKEFTEVKEKLIKESESKTDAVNKITKELDNVIKTHADNVNLFKEENETLKKTLALKESHIVMVDEKINEWKIKQDLLETKFIDEVQTLEKQLRDKTEDYYKLQLLLQENEATLNDRIADLNKRNADLEFEKNELISELEEIKTKLVVTTQLDNEELTKMKLENQHLIESLEAQKSDIIKLESLLMYEKQQNELLQQDNNSEKLNLHNKYDLLQEEHSKAQQELECRQKEIALLTVQVKELTEKSDENLRIKDVLINKLREELDAISMFNNELLKDKENLVKESESKAGAVSKLTKELEEVTRAHMNTVSDLRTENEALKKSLALKESYIVSLEEQHSEWKVKQDVSEAKTADEIMHSKEELRVKSEDYNKLQLLLQENEAKLNDRVADLNERNANLELDNNELITKLEEITKTLGVIEEASNEENSKMKQDNQRLLESLEAEKSEIKRLESLLEYEKHQNDQLQNDHNVEKLKLVNKCSILEKYQCDAQQELESKQKKIESLTVKVKELSEKIDNNLRDRDVLINQLRNEKDALISNLSKELIEEKEKWIRETKSKAEAVNLLTKRLEEVTRSETDTVKLLRKENEVLRKSLVLKDSFAAASEEKTNCKSSSQGVDGRDPYQQVDNTPTDHTQSSFENCKTISDLEKILQDRNRTIRSLQSDITDLKSLVAESENKLLDVSNELEVSRENCQQLSSQLKKIVHQKNEEIAELKKQMTKMSATENRASQIIKVSAKYQAIILKRIAEIKSNTVLKELTNFGNTTNCENDLRRSLTARTITMEDLENFLDTTDRHLKRFSEKQLALQKERDRLAEVNKINESEIINLKKFLTELSVSIKTFNSVKELYTQKMSRVVSLQRTVRRELLTLEGQVTDATMCKLERGYAAVMQDLSECAMNLERWVERTMGRIISTEKIKAAFSSEERTSLATTTFQSTSLDVQLEELENTFCKLLEEIARARKGEGAKDTQAVTVMEVRAEYEDKLNRMKVKMNELYKEQMGLFKEKQRKEIASLEQELQKAREKLEETSQAYEEHIRSLTKELWNVGEKFLMKKDEVEWLRRKQRSGSLMSLQHVHSSGLVPTQEEPSRPSDTHSLRSLPVTSNTNSKNGRTLQMSDEEGEVFDNRCLRELATTPAKTTNPRATRDAPPGKRLSELQWRNSLCPPHLKSSYPAETQFVSAIHEEDIKCVGGPSMSLGGRPQRKEVGITAYKKPGPPTPSKQAGRLSATDSELRESLRVETDPNASRKTSTPSRIRALFRSAKGDNEGTPRSRRLSNIFRKK